MLALRALNLGDLLVAVPALRGLRAAYPGHRIVLAAPAVWAPVAELSGAVDELAPTADPRALRWDRPAPGVVVNLHGAGPQSHRALDRAAGPPAAGSPRRIGFRDPDGGPGWTGPTQPEVAARHPHERDRWCALLAAHGIPADPADLRLPAPAGSARGAAPVLVHPGARFGAKRWPASRFAELARGWHRGGATVLVTGSAGERELARSVADAAGLDPSCVLAGHTDLAALCALVAGAALVVSGDTGIAHLASAFGTPSVSLFGPVDPAQWGPPPGPHRALAIPAARRGDPFADDPDPALLAIGVDEVRAAAAEVTAAADHRGRAALPSSPIGREGRSLGAPGGRAREG